MIRDDLGNLHIERNTNTITSKNIVKCPNCFAVMRKNGYAKRCIKTVIELQILTQTFFVQCYTCVHCKSNHRLIPNEWIPFCQYTKNAVKSILSSKYPIYETTLSRQKTRYKSNHFVPTK